MTLRGQETATTKLEVTEIERVEALHVTLEAIFCFNLKTCLSNNIENIFIDLLFPKTKPITVGVIYKPPNQTRFLEQIITEFETLDLHNEHYVLGDFNTNLLFTGKYIFDKPDQFRQFYKELSPEIKKYTEFCCTYGFKQLIKGPTRTTRSTSTLIDHILANTHE